MKQPLVTYEMSTGLALERVQTLRRALVLLAMVEANNAEGVAAVRRVQADLRLLADFLEGGL